MVCRAASSAKPSGCSNRWAWSSPAAGWASPSSPRRNGTCSTPSLIRWRLESGDRAAQLLSLSELRRGFEPAAAALAARRADPHQCRIMAAAVSDMVVHGRSGRPRRLSCWPTRSSTRPCSRPAATRCSARLNGVVAEVLTGRTHHGMMPEIPNPAAIDVARRGGACDQAARRGGRRTRDAGDHRRGGIRCDRRVFAVRSAGGLVVNCGEWIGNPDSRGASSIDSNRYMP